MSWEVLMVARGVLALFGLVLLLASAPTAAAVAPGTFDRMFPELPPFAEPTDQQIADLAGTMLDQGGAATDHPETPAGFTFFGQFLDHDLTLDTEPQPQAPVNLRTLDNDRIAVLDLDSVYGDGPHGTPQLYQSDGKHLKVGTSSGIPDVPREANGTAILADGRNDENLIIAQLHAAFLRFHNRLIDEGKRFAEARRLTRWHYQWLVVHDYLPRIVGQQNVDRFLDGNGEFYKPSNPRDPVLPVEFAVAAFRFGHSQVRPLYRLNAATPALRIFSLDPAIRDLRGGRPVPADAGIEWQRFFEVDGLPEAKNKMKLIDTKISQGLFELPIPGAAASGSNVLAFRNMVRGKHYGLPSGQVVAGAMEEPVITPAELDLGPGFDEGTPLWFYILAESERTHQGLRLGNVGARIVAEIFLTNLKRDEGSYLKAEPAFRPSVPHQGDFTIGDFLQFAGAV